MIKIIIGKILLTLLVLLPNVVLINFANASSFPGPITTENFPGASPGSSTGTSGFGDEGALSSYISGIYTWSIGIAAGLAVIMLIYAGYLYVTSAGNPEQINLAKEVIIGAIAGFVFLILAALILRAVIG